MAEQTHYEDSARVAPPDEMSGMNDCVADVIELFPTPPQEGFFNPVVDFTIPKYQSSRHGKTSLEVVTLANDRRYEVACGEPANQKTDIPVVFTTALMTSVNGHNWHTMLKLMDIGFPVVLVGPEGGNMHIPKSLHAAKRLVSNLVSINLEETAANKHNILNYTDNFGLYKPGTVANTGESRGDMALFAFNMQADSFNRNVLYSDGIGACFPVRRKNLKQHVSLLPETLVQTSLAGKISLEMSLRRAIELPRTINPNPFFIAHALATIPTLLSGSTGTYAGAMSRETKMNQTLFTGDSWCHTPGWMKILNSDAFPFVNVDLLPGNHMTIATERVQKAREERMRNLCQQLVESGDDPEAIDWSRVHLNNKTTA